MAESAAPLVVVLDTDVVLSALVFGGGKVGLLRRAWATGRIVPLASKATAAELMRVLAYRKFALTPVEQEALLADYLPYATSVRVGTRHKALPPCRDPGDQMFLELAVAGKADLLVSGDADLLAMQPLFSIPIVRVGALLERLAPTRGDTKR